MSDTTTPRIATTDYCGVQVAALRISWRDVSVVLSGVDRSLADDLAACLALGPPIPAVGGPCDFTVTRSGIAATVLVGARRHDVASQTDLFFLLTTLVPASLMEKSGVSRRMHAAGIRVGEKLLLVSGEGHMGKSSISLVAWCRGFEVLGDDWLLFNNDFTGMSPIPKPLKARMTAEQFAALNAGVGKGAAMFGNLLGETRALIGRGEGFYNQWDKPLPVGALVFLERPDDRGPIMERIAMVDALPLILSQTILCKNSKTLAGVAFVRTLAKRDIPVFRLCLGRSRPEAALDAILEATEPSLQVSRIMPLSSRF
jgi:hypothetical protein